MKNSGRRPPGPPRWPLIGNIFDLDAEAHHTLAKISNKYGPIVWLRLGAVNTMVVSSAEAAMDMFKSHDLSFAGRTTNEPLRVHCYDEDSMALGQYGPYWRMLRRICTTELFTNSRINGTESLQRISFVLTFILRYSFYPLLLFNREARGKNLSTKHATTAKRNKGEMDRLGSGSSTINKNARRKGWALE
ncbi:hypothetical protein IFM89_023536 [Coptis chinensis]|uniref:Cytochrome P450 n=1 Tax=Coptis chinensis TaxID=261450 RepID=A0A835H860_9MAGN|nr:hypothetical protein IFM89_023536 [Coptis chinensis]